MRQIPGTAGSRSPEPELARRFTLHERATIGILVALIVPADASGPGALEAGVVDTLDARVASSPTQRRLYRDGLRSLERFARRQYGRRFEELEADEQIRLLEILDAGPGRMRRTPSNLTLRVLRAAYSHWTGLRPASRFFRVLVRDVMGLFYSTEAAWAWLGYTGPPFRTQADAD